MVLTMAQFIKNNFLEEARKANLYGLMVDDVTDVSVKEQNIQFIQYYSVTSGMVEIRFLNVADLLETETRANADCITSCIPDELRRCDLKFKGTLGIRQYVNIKPIKRGIQLFTVGENFLDRLFCRILGSLKQQSLARRQRWS